MTLNCKAMYEIVRQHNFIPIEVYNFTNGNLLWLNSSLDFSPSEFLRRYAIGIPTSKCFTSIYFDMNSKKVAYADRYGGYGGASNGGGSRCANLCAAQIKGVGTNKLLGKNVINSWYAHGSLNIVDATCEVIYSTVLNKIMPRGAVESLGLILISNTTGYYGENVTAVEDAIPCRGALLVRKECVRPSHFLRARNYLPLDEYTAELISDVSRVRNINKALLNKVESKFGFIEFLSNIFSAHADQFAFALAARITHGSATSSNLTIDGKWIDFAATSFLPSGSNYQTGMSGPAFFDEHKCIEEIFCEFSDTYTKFNLFDLNVEPLLAYYRWAMNAYFHQHCSFLLGIPTGIWPEIGVDSDADLISKTLYKIIHINTTPILVSPTDININEDPVIIFLVNLYGMATNNIAAGKKFEELIGNSDRCHNLVQSFSKIIYNFSLINTNRCPDELFRISAIESIKRAYCSAFFYKDRLRKLLAKNLFVDNEKYFTDFIDLSISVGNFIFNTEATHKVYFFCMDYLKIWYCLKSSCYFIFCLEHNEQKFVSPKYFFDTIEQYYKVKLTINEFDFYGLFCLLRPILVV